MNPFAPQIVVELVPGKSIGCFGKTKDKLNHIFFQDDIEYKTLEELPSGGLYTGFSHSCKKIIIK